MLCQEEALACKSTSITARSGHSPLPGRRRPQHCRDDSLPVQDNPIQSNHLLNNWREASPHTADLNLNVPTTWERSSGSGNVWKKRCITWEVRRTLNCSPKAVAKLLFIQEKHLSFKLYKKCHFHVRQTPLPSSRQGWFVELSTIWYLGIVLPSLHCQGGDKVCQPVWVPQDQGSFPAPSPVPKGAQHSFLPHPEPSTHPCRDLGQRFPERTPVRIDPGNIPQHTHLWGTFWVVVWLFKGKILCYDKQTVFPIY